MAWLATLAPGWTRLAAPDRHPARPARGGAPVPVRRAAPGIRDARPSGHDGRGPDRRLTGERGQPRQQPVDDAALEVADAEREAGRDADAERGEPGAAGEHRLAAVQV